MLIKMTCVYYRYMELKLIFLGRRMDASPFINKIKPTMRNQISKTSKVCELIYTNEKKWDLVTLKNTLSN